jgi:predicted kinase
VLVIVAGLPGTGKSAVCRAVAGQIPGAFVMDKDRVREALFGPNLVEYTAEQDDFCIRVMLMTARYLWAKDAGRVVFLDGRTFSCRYQLQEAMGFAEAWGQAHKIVECVCSRATAHERIEADLRKGQHPARNRTPEMHDSVAAAFEPIPAPKVVVNTEEPLEECVAVVRRALGF